MDLGNLGLERAVEPVNLVHQGPFGFPPDRPVDEAADAAWFLEERRILLISREKHLARWQAHIDQSKVLLNEDRRELHADWEALPAAYHLPAPLNPGKLPPKPKPAPNTQS